jgi:hypothetical protein
MNAKDSGPLHTKAEIKSNVPQLKKGISIAKCKAMLGEPTMEQNSFAKERPVLIGTSLYYIVRKTKERLDPKTDSFLEVLFDRHGALVDVVRYNL